MSEQNLKFSKFSSRFFAALNFKMSERVSFVFEKYEIMEKFE